MQTNLLFPYRFKKAGWMLLIPGLLMGLLFFIFDDAPGEFELPVLSLFDSGLFSSSVDFFKLTKNNIFDEIACILILTGGILVAFSKEKTEDEYIARLRLESLVWACYVNYAILFLTLLFVFDLTFFWVLVLNMFTILLLFILKFRIALSKFKKTPDDEE